MNNSVDNTSPQWNTAVKLVVALSFAAIILALVMRFRNLIGPLLLVFILSFLINPAAIWLKNKTKFPWAMSVSIIYIVIIVTLLVLITWGGLSIVGQIQSFIVYIQKTVATLPDTINNLAAQTIQIGTFTIDLSTFDLNQILNPLLNSVEPILTNVGGMLTKFAGGAAEVIGWIAFIFLVSFFILLETKGMEGKLFVLEIPGYAEDFRRIGTELGKIWNAFLRGQMLIILITIVVYLIMLSILGVHYTLALAFLAGMARFVPYIGPAIAWTTLGLVTFFQGGNYFNLPPLTYSIMAVAMVWFMDLILDNFVATRMLAKTLRVHPAAVLVMALIGANLIGVIGVVLASPVTASLKLFWHYVLRKMFNLNPWEGLDVNAAPQPPPEWMMEILRFLQSLLRRVTSRFHTKTD